jgi:hypothetical protein
MGEDTSVWGGARGGASGTIQCSTTQQTEAKFSALFTNLEGAYTGSGGQSGQEHTTPGPLRSLHNSSPMGSMISKASYRKGKMTEGSRLLGKHAVQNMAALLGKDADLGSSRNSFGT